MVSPVYPGTVLQIGSFGTEVARMQTYLNNLRRVYPVLKPLAVDGRYGNGTAQTVGQYQTLRGLQVDGRIGAQTWNTLVTENNALTGDSADTYPGIPMQSGSTGQDVTNMQRELNSIARVYTAINVQTVDGRFGANCTSAVQRFQRQFGLTADGVIGKVTWNKIVEVFGTHMPVSTPYPGTPVQQGSSGNNTRFVQSYVTAAGFPATVDGQFGAKTRQAVTAFQAVARLNPDGIVGAITWSTLVSAFNNTL